MNKCVTLLGLSKKFQKEDKWLVIASSSTSRTEILSKVVRFTNSVLIPSQFDENLDKSLYTPLEYIQQTALCKAQTVAKSLWSCTSGLESISMFSKVITPFHSTNPFSNNSKFPFVVGFDTVMFKDNRIFEKPSSRDDAKSQLKALSGETHQVITGVAIFAQSHGYEKPVKLFYDSTTISLDVMTDEELELVLDQGDYKNVCGSYKLDGVGSQFSTFISGSYTNVMGLPVKSLAKELNELAFAGI